MAKTKADVINGNSNPQPKHKAKAKAATKVKTKNEDGTKAKRRKTEAVQNPFELPPPTGQASMATFLQPKPTRAEPEVEPAQAPSSSSHKSGEETTLDQHLTEPVADLEPSPASTHDADNRTKQTETSTPTAAEVPLAEAEQQTGDTETFIPMAAEVPLAEANQPAEKENQTSESASAKRDNLDIDTEHALKKPKHTAYDQQSLPHESPGPAEEETPTENETDQQVVQQLQKSTVNEEQATESATTEPPDQQSVQHPTMATPSACLLQAETSEAETSAIDQQISSTHAPTTVGASLSTCPLPPVKPEHQEVHEDQDEIDGDGEAEDNKDNDSAQEAIADTTDFDCDCLGIDQESFLAEAIKAQVVKALGVNGTKERLLNIPQVWTLCSTCTGSGSFEMASKLIAQSLNERLGMGSECSFEVQLDMACENEKFKQNLLLKHILDGTTCLFHDVTTLSKDDERKCLTHSNACDLPQEVFGFVSGFSCKSVSKLQNDSALRKAMAERNQESSSFKTFAGNLDVLDASQPLWCVFENIDLGDYSPDSDESNAVMITKLLMDWGYTTRMVLLRADDFGLPQRRMRLFIIGINNKRAQNELISTPTEILTMAINVYLPVVKLKPPSVDFFLQNDDDPDVQAELERRIKNAERRESNRHDPDKEKRSADTEGKGEKWKDLHMSIAASRGISWPIRVHSDVRASDWFDVLPLREQEIAGMAYAARTPNRSAEIRFVDLYHSANRTPTSSKEVVPTVLPSGTVWDFERMRVHLGIEQLALQGITFPPAAVSQLSNNQMQDLAGNAFPTTVVSAVVISLVSSLTYVSSQDAMSLDNINDLIKMLE